jgi:hypothetical protein
MLNWLLPCFVFFLSLPSLAGNYLSLYGGAGEPADSNMFTSDFIKTTSWARDHEWNINDVLFDGDNQNLQSQISSTAKKPVTSLTQGNFLISLMKLSADAKSGRLKEGDQVLIMVDDHGESDKTAYSHAIRCEGISCDPSYLKDVIKQLEQRGIRVAVVDFSCFSGQSLDLASDKTCVVTATTANDVGWNDFSGNFIANMKTGTSLESVFLKTRAESTGRAQISSPAGTETTRIIESLAKESRYDVSDSHSIPQTGAPACPSAAHVDEMLKTLTNSRDMSLWAVTALPEAQEYITASGKYADIYSGIQDLGQKITSYSNRLVGQSNWVELALATDDDLKDVPYLARAKKQLEKNPEFQNLEKMTAEFEKKAGRAGYVSVLGVKIAPNKLTAAALKTQDAEKKLYDRLYKSYQGHKDNPCAKFIL